MTDDSHPCRAVLLDIEGTIAPIAYVHDTLFPYARTRIPDYVLTHWDAPGFLPVRQEIERNAGSGTMQTNHMVQQLLDWMDQDAKITGLKQLQGIIWQDGYARGELQSVVFDDLPPALMWWKNAGIPVSIYSSGSVLAQQMFLRHTAYGDLTSYLTGFYDTTSGGKREPASYARIAQTLGIPARSILFISDVVAELDAATAAGMQVYLAVRPGNPPVGAHSYTTVTSLRDLYK